MHYQYKNVNLYYEEEGDGFPILFLHGWGANLQSFYCLTQSLKKNFRCILVDFMGHGKSEESCFEWTMDDFYLSIVTLLNFLNIKEVNIVSHSFGGRVSLMLLKKCAIVKKAVLFAPAGVKPRFSFKKFFKEMFYKFKRLLWRYGLISGNFMQNSGSIDYRRLNFVMKKTFVNIIKEDLSKYANEVKNECVLVYGEGDTAVPLYMVKKLNKLMKNSTFYTMGGGHFCYLEHKSESQSLIYDFLKEV